MSTAEINIEELPMSELQADRIASVEDIRVCERALAVNITHHADGLPVTERISVNRGIIEKIDAEIVRREEAAAVSRREQLRARVAEIKASGMQCTCDLDRWEPQPSTGHSWVCNIHKAAMNGGK